MTDDTPPDDMIHFTPRPTGLVRPAEPVQVDLLRANTSMSDTLIRTARCARRTAQAAARVSVVRLKPRNLLPQVQPYAV